jgi:hypothetical protein
MLFAANLAAGITRETTMLNDTVMDHALRALADATAPTPEEAEMAREIPRHAGCERQIRAGMNVAEEREREEFDKCVGDRWE